MRKTIRELQATKNADAMADIRHQIANGTLRIRQMTADERIANPPRPRRPKPLRAQRPTFQT